MPASRYIFGALPWYSVLIVAGICVAFVLAEGEKKRLHLPHDTVVDLALCIVPAGVIGARLYYVVFAWDLFRADPISVLYVWNGGLAIYGGIIGGLLAAVAYALTKKLSVPMILDLLAPSVVIAQAIGRWGNFFNMEAYGAPVTIPGWQFFPAAVLIPGPDGTVWHMATFFYESMWDLTVFIVLRLLRKGVRKPGSLVCWYALLYGAGRLVIEGLRMDSLMTTGGNARVSQLLSVALCLAVVVLFAIRTLGRPQRRQFPPAAAAAIAVLVACLLLPRPEEPFLLAHAVWTVLCTTGVFASCLLLTSSLSSHRRLWAILPLTVIAASLVVRTILAMTNAAGLGTDTLCCFLYSAAAIACAAALYAPLHADAGTPAV